MRATICESENGERVLWEGEVLSANWDGTAGEFVIRGRPDDDSFSAVVARIAEGERLTIGVGDNGSTQIVWRGRVGSARFGPFEAEHVDCTLDMALDDWFGVCAEFPGP